eukprot:8159266-Pyramimonas_sp.AAC.1
MSKLYPIFEGARDRTATPSPAELKRAKRQEYNKTYCASLKGQAQTKKHNPKNNPKHNAKNNAKNSAKNNPIYNAERKEARRIAARERILANPNI